jgi:hypothetical protein
MCDHLDLMKGPCTPTCCTLLWASFFYFLLADSKHEQPVIGSISFVAKGAMALVPCEVIIVVMEVSSPEVGANVGHLFSNVVNQEQGNIIVKDEGPSSSEAFLPLRINEHRMKVMKGVP